MIVLLTIINGMFILNASVGENISISLSVPTSVKVQEFFSMLQMVLI